MKWWWLSFANDDLPPGSKFLGAAIVGIADGCVRDAAREAWRLGCNPGGEVLGGVLPGRPPAKWCNRLLSKAEALALEELEWPWPESIQ